MNVETEDCDSRKDCSVRLEDFSDIFIADIESDILTD